MRAGRVLCNFNCIRFCCLAMQKKSSCLNFMGNSQHVLFKWCNKGRTHILYWWSEFCSEYESKTFPKFLAIHLDSRIFKRNKNIFFLQGHILKLFPFVKLFWERAIICKMPCDVFLHCQVIREKKFLLARLGYWADPIMLLQWHMVFVPG